MEAQELIAILEKSFLKNAKVRNGAIKKVYNYSKQMQSDSNEDKIEKILPLINSNHIYVKYWGAVMALSYKIMEEIAIKELIYILDINPKEFEDPLELNLLKLDVGSYLYDYKKNGIIGSFPGQNENNKQKIFPNYSSTVRYYRHKYKL